MPCLTHRMPHALQKRTPFSLVLHKGDFIVEQHAQGFDVRSTFALASFRCCRDEVPPPPPSPPPGDVGLGIGRPPLQADRYNLLLPVLLMLPPLTDFDRLLS